ncbi:MAG: DUF4288 domain-containing protein [Pyrinomonadaceae bacterium]
MMDFYSARLLFICLVDDGKPKKKNLCDDSVVAFRARDFDDAFRRAVEIGKAREQEYLNGGGQKVRWALVEVLNLDWVGRKIDGAEVASKLHYRVSAKPMRARAKFHPEKSKPDGSF